MIVLFDLEKTKHNNKNKVEDDVETRVPFRKKDDAKTKRKASRVRKQKEDKPKE